MADQQTNRYRSINFGLLLYESLRGYYSVNSSGKVNWLYKLCAALIQPLVAPFATYEAQRITNGLIANSKFQIGQLTNVLNYLYDNVENRIYITQGFFNQPVSTNFNQKPLLFSRNFGQTPGFFARNFDDPISFTGAVIHVPYSANLSALTATVAQMALLGRSYLIVQF